MSPQPTSLSEVVAFGALGLSENEAPGLYMEIASVLMGKIWENDHQIRVFAEKPAE